jgi:hypothetical protein
MNLGNKAILLKGLTASISSGRGASVSEDIAVGCLGIIGHLLGHHRGWVSSPLSNKAQAFARILPEDLASSCHETKQIQKCRPAS